MCNYGSGAAQVVVVARTEDRHALELEGGRGEDHLSELNNLAVEPRSERERAGKAMSRKGTAVSVAAAASAANKLCTDLRLPLPSRPQGFGTAGEGASRKLNFFVALPDITSLVDVSGTVYFVYYTLSSWACYTCCVQIVHAHKYAKGM